MTGADAGAVVHASCVAVQGRGVLILGPSGAGKSALALELMALGAELVADDRTELAVVGGRLRASCPAALHGLIEARGVGILRATPADSAEVSLAVDLAARETDRLPPFRHMLVLGVQVDLVLGQEGRHFPASILRYVTGGRQA